MGAGMGYKHPTDLLRVIEISWGGRWEDKGDWMALRKKDVDRRINRTR